MTKLVFIFVLLSFNVFATQGKIEEKHYVIKPSKYFLKTALTHPEITLDHLSSEGVEVYGPKGTGKWLVELNQKIDDLYFIKQQSWSKSFEDYPSYIQNKRLLESLHKKYPSITKLFSIGKSVEGRDLLVMKISDNANLDEVEPEFKFISSMHGDEITGRELTIRLIQDLLSSYGKESRITNLINNTEIFIMPSMNPDGSEKRERANANFYDLNRNFPLWNDKKESTKERQPETIAVMNFQKSRQFSLSANFHGGAVCVNYPWDSTLERHPLDDLLIELSLAYSIHNTPMYQSSEFERGITNGADWYTVKGGMQDWSYVFYNDLQVTIELSDQKWPEFSKIDQFYEDNKESMLAYMELIHQGAGVKLQSNQDGLVSITKLYKDKPLSIGSFKFRNGEFYKVLNPGIYQFEIKTKNELKVLEVNVSDKDNIANYHYL